MSDEQTLWSQASNYIAAAATALIGIIWADNKRRVERVESQLESKADVSEMNRQRDNVSALFDKMDEMKGQIHAMHVDLLEKIK